MLKFHPILPLLPSLPQAEVDAASGVNRHLMHRKEEVEWQLMAAMAKVRLSPEGGTLMKFDAILRRF